MISIDRPSSLAEAVGRESILARRVLGVAFLGALWLVALQLDRGDAGIRANRAVARATAPVIVSPRPEFDIPDWFIDFDKNSPLELAAPPALQLPPITAVVSRRLPS